MAQVQHPVSWKGFIALAAGCAATLVLLTFLFIAAVNPYGNLPISLPFEHHRVTGNERFAFPGLLRSRRYDAAVLGTSTVMLLHPQALDENLGGKFVNLSMGSATPFEQLQILDEFRRTQRPGQVLVAIDSVWCDPNKRQDKLTFRPFPPWMYDDNRWNDYLHLLNDRALVHAIRQAAIWLGLARPPFGPDGYFQFVPDISAYDLAKARLNIYGRVEPRPAPAPFQVLRDAERPFSGARYPDLSDLFAAIDRLPPDASTTLVFVPYHASRFGTPEAWASWADCKLAAVRKAADRKSVTVLDFMRPSPLTLSDSNYWDPLHYTVEQAGNIVRALGRAKAGENSNPLFEVLHRPGWAFEGALK